MIKTAAARLERLLTFGYLVIFAGVFWPPDGYFERPGPRTGSYSNIYDFMMFVSLIAFLAIVTAARRRDMLRLLRVAWPILVLTGFAFVSALWSDDPVLVIRRAGTVSLTTLFAVHLIARSDPDEFIALLVKVYAVAMFASLAMILISKRLAISGNETYVSAWRGAFTDKNTLGLACALALIIALYAFRARLGPRWLAALTIAAALVLLKLAESKTPVVVMAAAVYAAAIGNALRRRSGAGLATGFALTVVALAGAALIALFLQDALALLGRDSTFTNRAKLWHYALVYIAKRPWLGYGYGAFWRNDGVEANQFWALVEFHTPHSHNAWLELGLGVGIVGLGLIALTWLAGLYRVFRVLTAPAARHVSFCLALMAGIFVENLTEYEFFRSGDIVWVLFVAVIVYLGRARQLDLETRRAEAAARRLGTSIPIPAAAQRAPA
jgi:O-antigen ligase